ncbi:MAG: hypothetical protein QXS69_00420 [Candidatus Aenigmatarchaeota archaeon]
MKESEIDQKIKEGYVLAEMWFEAVAIEKKASEDALKEHLKKLSEFSDIKILEETFLNAKRVKNLETKNKMYSAAAKTKILAKDIYALIFATILFAPSSVIILKPEKFNLDLITMQTIINTFADLIHRISRIGGKILIPLPYQKDITSKEAK